MIKTLLQVLNLRTILLPLALLVLLMQSSCSTTRSVPEGDYLFDKYKVEVKATDSSKIADESAIKLEMNEAVHPKPNTSILGLKFGLYIHNWFGPTKKEKGLKYWFKYKLGEPPVLLSQLDTNRISEVIGYELHNRGYFDNTVSSNSTLKNKKASITWTAEISKPFTIRKLEFPQADSLPVYALIRESQANSLLAVDKPYNLQVMIAERQRINDYLKDRGYYYFSPDNIVFKVDSTVTDKKVDVFVRIKSETPKEALQAYHLDDIYIYTNYSLSDTAYANDTIRYKEYYYLPNEDYVKAKHLLEAVFLEQGELYSRNDQQLTASRLTNLGIFKYVNLDYRPDTTAENENLLDVHIFLTQAMKKSLRLEAQAVTKTNNFAGPGFIASFRNRNALRGSELLTVNLESSYETQISGQNSGLNSYELGVTTALTIPRFVAPIKVRNLRSEFAPTTRIGLGFRFMNRVEFFQMNSYNATYSYNWKPKRPVTHEITPINLHYVRLGNTTAAFDSILNRNTFLKRSFEQQFILGSIYDYIYNTQVYTDRTHHFYFNFNFDQSGFLTNAFQSATGKPKPTEDNPRTFIGQPFSQYSRFLTDFRYYYKTGRESMIATRLIAGVGIPYGNSTTLPYIKQFTIGGTNSIRAFRARSIGPGTYEIPEELALSYFDQTGDIKLETNIEYRFPISGFFKGAVFVDAGNIWLLEESEDRPGGEFKSSSFLNQLAVGTGFGLRVDVEFFVIRFDLGVPVRDPSGGGRNVLSDFRPGLGGDNGFVLNIAIGYPF